jgi:hypothetical protein
VQQPINRALVGLPDFRTAESQNTDRHIRVSKRSPFHPFTLLYCLIAASDLKI